MSRKTSDYDADNDLIERAYSGESQQLRFDFTNDGDGNPLTMTSYSDLAGTSLVATTYDSYNGNESATNIQSYDAGSTLINEFTYAINNKNQVTAETDTQGGTCAVRYSRISGTIWPPSTRGRGRFWRSGTVRSASTPRRW